MSRSIKSKIKETLSPILAHAGFGGHDIFIDIKKRIPSFNPTVILDVGANIGEYAAYCASRFPNAMTYAFEPGEANYARLVANTEKLKVQPLKLGLSSSAGSVNFVHDANRPTMSHISEDETTGEQVQIMRLDDFLAERGIGHVSYLKIDTEGYDLEVLKGAEDSLKNGIIDFVEVEAGINPDNDYHVNLHKFTEFLFPQDYYIFGFYEQTMEWTKNLPHLRRCNVVFMKTRS